MWSAIRTFACMSVLAGTAWASPYWVACEGNDYPENEGWIRNVDGPAPAQRSLSDGIMTLDGLADRQIDDWYLLERPLDAGADETFIMQWRLRVNAINSHPLYPYDQSVAMFTDTDRGLSLVYGVHGFRNYFEDVNFTYAPHEFHSFELRSTDMLTYQLWMDGTVIHAGVFWDPAVTSSYVAWGDGVQGSASISEWDYFRFGVVPEPTSFFTLTALSVACFGVRTRGKM
ncbi:MAG: hypothetical protein ACKVS9_17605 [Phycisphaerae bacterium]